MSQTQILLVEDDAALRQALSVTLELAGRSFQAFDQAESALQQIQPDADQILITDFRLPGMSGLDLLASAQSISPRMPVVVMTAYADTKLAVDALKGGARDFLVKPFTPEQLLEVISRLEPTPSPDKIAASGEIIAADPASLALIERCARVAATDATVLLTGNSGVGKDVFARQLHARSNRSDKPYVAINCAAIPENLLEATLFGYERGAFTGANRSHPGKFEQAHEGTLFLDEIGEMPIELQPKLLRVLQDQVVERLGSVQSKTCNVRIIAATNQDLAQRVKEGRFREDLYFRLAVFPIRIPTLAERAGDILPLAKSFLAKYSRTMNRPNAELTPQAQALLASHAWPGNVRELENVIQRALLMADGPQIGPDLIELEGGLARPTPPLVPAASQTGTEIASDMSKEGDLELESIERAHILKVLKQVNGNRKAAVDLLGISERALRYKLKAYKEAGFTVD